MKESNRLKIKKKMIINNKNKQLMKSDKKNNLNIRKVKIVTINLKSE